MAVLFNKYVSKVTSARVFKSAGALLLAAFFSAGYADPALAQAYNLGAVQGDISKISENIVESVEFVPGLITGFAYLLGLVFGIWGVFKVKDHVENPDRTPIRMAIARFLIGGALFALPIIFEAARVSITGAGGVVNFTSFTDVATSYSGLFGWVGGAIGGLGINTDINFIFAAIIGSLRNVPGLITATAYLLGLVFAVNALLKIKEHIENPEQTGMREGVIRLLTAGALFALPNVYDAMQATIAGDGSAFGTALGIIGDITGILGGAGDCNPVAGVLGGLGIPGLGGGGATTVGGAMCNLVTHTAAISAFLTALAYLFGLVLGVWGILKIQDHVLNPAQTSVWEGVSRFIAAGLFFSLPFITEVMQNTVAPPTLIGTATNALGILNSTSGALGAAIGAITGGGGIGGVACALLGICPGGGAGGPTCNGLDNALNCFIMDIFAPLSAVLTMFAAAAGTILIMIGISRLIKSANEGARGPGGLGTMMTFLTGGVLLSYNSILAAFGASFFNGGTNLNYGTLAYTTGMSPAEVAHAEIVVAAILKFMVLVGLISFVRGIFIIRNVAEGNQQASLMAGITHMVGGALAVNLGPLMNAVQATLGIAGFGITFA